MSLDRTRELAVNHTWWTGTLFFKDLYASSWLKVFLEQGLISQEQVHRIELVEVDPNDYRVYSYLQEFDGHLRPILAFLTVTTDL